MIPTARVERTPPPPPCASQRGDSDCGRRTKFFPLLLSTTSLLIGSSQTVLYCAHRALNAFINTNDPSKLARYLFRDGG